MAPRDILFAIIVAVLWGLNFVAIKWGVEAMPPLLLTALRYTCAAIPAVFFLRPPKARPSLVIAYGFTIGVLQFGTLYAAIKLGMPAGLSSLVVQMQAFFTIGFAMLVLGERSGAVQVIGALTALAGVVVIAAERLSGAVLVPLLMTLAAAAFWAVGNILTKQAGKIDMLAFVAWSSLVPPIPLLAASLLTEGPAADWAALTHPTWLLVGTIAYSGYLSTVAGYGLWSILLARYPASTVVPFSLLVPIVGIGSNVLLSNEHLSLLELIGSAVIFCGLMINVFGPRLRRPAAASV